MGPSFKTWEEETVKAMDWKWRVGSIKKAKTVSLIIIIIIIINSILRA